MKTALICPRIKLKVMNISCDRAPLSLISVFVCAFRHQRQSGKEQTYNRVRSAQRHGNK